MSEDLIPDAATLIRINNGIDEFMANWKQVGKARAESLKKRREATWRKRAQDPKCDWTTEYDSGFRWVFNRDRLDLISPCGKLSASVSLRRGPRGHCWHVWDEDGVGGENSSEPTIERAKITAESAVLRWGQHLYETRTEAGR